MKPEQLLATRASNYLQVNHTAVIFRFDLAADVPLPIAIAKRNKALQGKWSTGYPDMLIAKCAKGFGGLYIELKATKTLHKSKHTDRQKVIHQILRNSGYMVEFAFGFDDFVRIVEDYLSL